MHVPHWSWPALIALGVSGAVAAQQHEEDPEAPADAEVQGLLPVPEYAGEWRTRPALSGDWGGTRQDWAERGLTIDVDWLQVGQGVVSGGLDTGWAYASNLDWYATLDLDRMDVAPGALVSFRGQTRFGETVNGDTGLLLPVNTYSYFPLTDEFDENVAFAVTELNWLQFFSEEVGVQAGKITTMETMNEFSGGEGRSQFMNFQFIWSAAFAQTAPYSTLAVAALWMPDPQVVLTSVLMNSEDASTTSGFDDIGEGTSWWTSVDTQYRLGDLPGGMGLGGIYAFDGDFAKLGGIYIDPGAGIAVGTEEETWSLYWHGWQYLHTEAAPPELIDVVDGRQDLEGVGLFAILGLADEDTNPVSWSAAAGLGGRGLIPDRGDDTCGLGWFYNDLQEFASLPNALDGSAQGIEAYYNIALAQSVALTADVQWTQSAFPRVDDAVVLGARLHIGF